MTQILDNNPNSLDLNLPGFGPDTVYGRQGADTITSSTQGGSLIYGEEGNDSLIAKGAKDTLYGGPDEDILTSQQTLAYLDGEAGADTLIAQATATLHGGAGDDYVQGTGQGNTLLGDGANDTIIGGAVGTDTLIGGKGNDVLGFLTAKGQLNFSNNNDFTLGTGNQGGNFMRGDRDNDSLYAINQRDTLLGGKDNDTLLGAGSYSYLSGDEGNDVVFYNQNTTGNSAFGSSVFLLTYEKVTLVGGAGNDSIIGPIGPGPLSGSKNLIVGDAIDGTTPVGTTPGTTAGNDTLVTYGKQDTVLGGAGNDLITSKTGTGVNSSFVPLTTADYFGKNILDGGDGNDTITAASITDTMIGGAGNDSLGGLFTSASGGDGNDTINGTANGTLPATLNGDNGNDYLIGGRSAPNSFGGGAGNDTIFYGTTSDQLIGDLSGDDYISATNVNLSPPAFPATGSTPVLIFDNTGNNFFLGSSTVDSIVGGAGNDFMFGDAQNDTLLGADGNNTLAGGDGNDNIVGGSGNDSIIGGAGSDGMLGGGGNDSFVYGSPTDGGFTNGGNNAANGTNIDYIGDYNAAEDKLLINKAGFGINVQALALDVNFTNTTLSINSPVVAYDTNSGNVWFFPVGFSASLPDPTQPPKIIPSANDTQLANLTNKPGSIQASVQFF
jgi:Ca2+-binding RTX toxin-like protein